MRSEYPKLKFACRQHWEDMKDFEGGKFCEKCEHKVHDLTAMTNDEIKTVIALNGSVCGLLTAEQLNPHMRPLEVPKMMRYGFASLVTFLGLELSNARAQISPNGKPPVVMNDSVVVDEDSMVCLDSTRLGDAIAIKDKPQKSREARKIRRKKYYVSARFPFIHKRYRRSMGCPMF